MTYNTGNPVPSTDPRDLDDNSQAFDRFLQSTAASEPDRLGVLRKTWHQMEADAAALVSPNVAAFASLTGAANRLPYFTGAGALSLATITAFARTLLDDADATAARATLGLTIGGANGVAQLGADGKLPTALLPPLAINEVFTVANQAAMLALTAQRGDVAIRSDLSGAAYILSTDDPTTLANWIAIQQNLGAAVNAISALTPAANQIVRFTSATAATLQSFTTGAQALAALTYAADRIGYTTSASAAAVTALTAFGRSLIDDADAATARTTLGVLAQTDKPAWTTYTPTVTPTAGTFTSASATGKYVVNFGICHFQAVITITTLGTGTLPNFTLPVAALSGSAQMPIPARESAINGKTGSAVITASLTSAQCRDYANGELATANGVVIYVNGSYPIA